MKQIPWKLWPVAAVPLLVLVQMILGLIGLLANNPGLGQAAAMAIFLLLTCGFQIFFEEWTARREMPPVLEELLPCLHGKVSACLAVLVLTLVCLCVSAIWRIPAVLGKLTATALVAVPVCSAVQLAGQVQKARLRLRRRRRDR